MKSRTLISILLMLTEGFCFYIMGILLNYNNQQMICFGIILWVLLMMSQHYIITSSLVWEEMKSLFKVMSSFLVIMIVVNYSLNPKLWLKSFVLSCVMFLVCLFLDRYYRIVFRKLCARRTLVIGTGYSAMRIGKIAQNNRFAMTRILAYVKLDQDEESSDCLDEEAGKMIEHYQIYQYHELDKAIHDNKIEQVLIALPNSSKEKVNELMQALFDKVEVIKYLPNLDILMTFNTRVQDFDGILLISTSRKRSFNLLYVVKRLFDICAAIVGCLALIPLTLYVRHLNHKNNDYDPIFFTQTRIGKNGKPIKIYKYRTMVPNAEQILEEMMENDEIIKEEYLKNKKLINDPRITEAGKFLRRTSLDEFPQFLNVLKGEMSLVGPRPYLYREKDDMGIYYTSIIRCKPGITGMWQANGRSDLAFEERCKLDDYYFRNWSLGLDMIIIYKTIKGVLYGKGAL